MSQSLVRGFPSSGLTLSPTCQASLQTLRLVGIRVQQTWIQILQLAQLVTCPRVSNPAFSCHGFPKVQAAVPCSQGSWRRAGPDKCACGHGTLLPFASSPFHTEDCPLPSPPPSSSVTIMQGKHTDPRGRCPEPTPDSDLHQWASKQCANMKSKLCPFSKMLQNGNRNGDVLGGFHILRY